MKYKVKTNYMSLGIIDDLSAAIKEKQFTKVDGSSNGFCGIHVITGINVINYFRKHLGEPIGENLIFTWKERLI